MTRRAAAFAAILLLCGCAAAKPAAGPAAGAPAAAPAGPQITAVRATFRSHLSVVRNCESRGVAPTIEAAKSAGANLALVFAPPLPAPPGKAATRERAGDETWVLIGAKPAAVAGVRAFKCPDAFVEKVTAEANRPPEATK